MHNYKLMETTDKKCAVDKVYNIHISLPNREVKTKSD